jgi:hypothetical protein
MPGGEGELTLTTKSRQMLQFESGPWGRPLGELLTTRAAYAGCEGFTIGLFRIRPIKISQT